VHLNGVWFHDIVGPERGPKATLFQLVAAFASSSPSLWNDLERGRVSRTDHREMPAVERCELHELETFSRGNDGGIHGAEGQVSIDRHELGDPDPVARANRLRDQVPRRQVTQESDFGFRTESRLEQVRHLAHNELRNDQRPGMFFQESEAGFVISIVLVDVRVERPGVDDQRDRRASRRRISSIRRAVSRRPLRPAFAAINRR
jgi:hypothetical protein